MDNELLWDQLRNHLRGVREHAGYYSAYCPFHDDQVEQSLLLYKTNAYCMKERKRYSLRAVMQKAGGNVGSRDDSTSSFSWQGIGDLETFCYAAHDVLLSVQGTMGVYLKERGVEKMIKPALLGWHAGWFVIPLINREGGIFSCAVRSSQDTQNRSGCRHSLYPGHTPGLYSPDWSLVMGWGSKLGSNRVFSVAGLFDALTLAVLGLPVVTPVPGLAFGAEWYSFTRKEVVFVPDRGEENMARRFVSEVGARGRLLCLDYPEGVDDPNDYAWKLKDTSVLRKQLLRRY